MYPFGSGMPSLPNNQSYNPSHNNMPFGAGFQPPSNNNNNPPRSGNTPYPNSSSQQTPYPQYPSGNIYQTPSPYPTSQQNYYNQSPYPSAYPSTNTNSTPYPPFGAGFQMPRNQQSPQQPSYPSAGVNPVQQQTSYGQPYPYPSTPSSTSIPYPTNSHPHPQTQGIPNVSPQQNQHKMNYNRNMSKCITEMRTSMVHGAKKAANKGTPTVFPNSDFDAVKDAHALRKAMKGFGTDEDALINIICRRTNAERLEIQRQYKTHFGKDLIEDIKSETSGNFENLLVGLLRPIVDFYLRELCEAMTGVGTDEDVLIEVMCTLSNAEIQTIKHAYLRVYGRHLESEFKSETSGNFKRLLVSLCTGQRDESNYTDLAAAQHDAKELLKAGELRVGTDESMFNQILCTRNYEQLRLVFQEYQSITGHSLEKAIKHEFSGDIKDGLLAIYQCVTNKYEFFASRLHKSMAGIGTDDQQLIRIIVTRCEIDMQDIKSAFERKYGKSLKSWIKGDTSGHYKHALYALIGEERSS